MTKTIITMKIVTRLVFVIWLCWSRCLTAGRRSRSRSRFFSAHISQQLRRINRNFTLPSQLFLIISGIALLTPIRWLILTTLTIRAWVIRIWRIVVVIIITTIILTCIGLLIRPTQIIWFNFWLQVFIICNNWILKLFDYFFILLIY